MLSLKVFVSLSLLPLRAYAPYPGTYPATSMSRPGEQGASSLLEATSQLGLSTSAQQLSASVAQLQAALREQQDLRAEQAASFAKHRKEALQDAAQATRMLEAARARLHSVKAAEAQLKPKRRAGSHRRPIYAHAAAAPGGAMQLAVKKKSRRKSNAASEDSPSDSYSESQADGESEPTDDPVAGEQEDDDEEDLEEEAEVNKQGAALEVATAFPQMLEACKVDTVTAAGAEALKQLKDCTEKLKAMARSVEQEHGRSRKSNKAYVGKFAEISSLMKRLQDVEDVRIRFNTDTEKVRATLLNKTTILNKPIKELWPLKDAHGAPIANAK